MYDTYIISDLKAVIILVWNHFHNGVYFFSCITNHWSLMFSNPHMVRKSICNKRIKNSNILKKHFRTFFHLCSKKFPSFVVIQTLYQTKELKWFQSVSTKINFCWPTLRNNSYGIVFNYLPQSLYKDKEKNWHILCCIYLLRTYGC